MPNTALHAALEKVLAQFGFILVSLVDEEVDSFVVTPTDNETVATVSKVENTHIRQLKMTALHTFARRQPKPTA